MIADLYDLEEKRLSIDPDFETDTERDISLEFYRSCLWNMNDRNLVKHFNVKFNHVGFEDMTRIDWVVMGADVSEDDARLLLAFKYFILTRKKGLAGEELNEAMEVWVDRLCEMDKEQIDELLKMLKEVD